MGALSWIGQRASTEARVFGILEVQNAYLSTLNNQQDITHIEDLTPVLGEQLYLWQGDITTLAVDGIVNRDKQSFLRLYASEP